jgi:hypothetical protein
MSNSRKTPNWLVLLGWSCKCGKCFSLSRYNWCGRFVYKNINNKIITRNNTNPYRIGLYWGCRTLRIVGGFIKLFEIKYNLIKRCLIWFLFSKNKYIKVKDINIKRLGMRERIEVDFTAHRIIKVNHKLTRKIHTMHYLWLVSLE